ncbi:MAG TPA: ATP-binding protein, partial [Candidatus Bathyarchaeia archaeon]|nr:ATP-binding protein [Candidatus Bathyarchaeia archaeon]
VSGRDEIGVLAKTVNEMAEQIKEKIADVELGRSRLEAVFSSMIEGVLVVDGQGKIFLMNDALRSLLGIVENPTGKRPIEVIRNADIQDMIVRSQSQERLTLSREIIFFVPDQKMMRVQSAPIYRDSAVAGAVLVFHDITELRRLENIRKEFVANVSHELRTPVSSIKGYAETLLEGALTDQDNAEDFVRIISNEAERLAKLIEDLLDLSSIESGKMIKDMAQCSLKTVLNQVLENIQIQARAHHVQIRVSGLDESVVVPGDELGLFRMFFNLLENAIKYNKEYGRIDVDFNMLGTHIEIKIKDTGVGIPEKDIPRIFERFYRVDKAHSRQIGGTGLGLSIVKHIVQAHNGTIAVQSVLGEGSLFTIILPRG